MWLIPIILRMLYTNNELNTTQDKRVIYITLWLPWSSTISMIWEKLAESHDTYLPSGFFLKLEVIKSMNSRITTDH